MFERSVTFVELEKFTDVRRTEWEHDSHSLLAALAKFMQETGERALPPEMQLSIKVTDVKLAGDFEPWLACLSIRRASSRAFIRRASS